MILETFKNICVAIVLAQAIIWLAIAVFIFVEKKCAPLDDTKDVKPYHSYCQLTFEPCIYAGKDETACRDCPEYEKIKYEEERSTSI